LPLPKADDTQLDEDGKALAVHVMPSGDVAAAVELIAMAKNALFP
jgi:hypothetical protein